MSGKYNAGKCSFGHKLALCGGATLLQSVACNRGIRDIDLRISGANRGIELLLRMEEVHASRNIREEFEFKCSAVYNKRWCRGRKEEIVFQHLMYL